VHVVLAGGGTAGHIEPALNLADALRRRDPEIGITPLGTRPHALFPQGRRFPLVFGRLRTALPTWERLLPETRDPRDAAWRDDPTWVLKPTWGRVGEAIGLVGVTPAKEQRAPNGDSATSAVATGPPPSSCQSRTSTLASAGG